MEIICAFELGRIKMSSRKPTYSKYSGRGKTATVMKTVQNALAMAAKANQTAKPKYTGRVISYGKKNTSKRTTGVKGQDTDYASTNVVIGRRPKNDFRQLSKFIRSNISQSVYSMHVASRFGGLNGQIYLDNNQSALGAELFTPLHMYDVTGVVNHRNGAIINPVTFWRVSFTNETTTAAGRFTAGGGLSLESAPNSNGKEPNYPGNSSVLKWVQAKLMFYAPTALPSKITVQMVQFIDQDLEPDTRTNTPQVMTTRGTAWYQAYLKKLMFSPIETTQAGGFKGIKVLHSETFIINPKESTEPTSTHYKQLELFKWFNRKCSYDWDQTVQTSDLTTTPAAELDQNQNTVHPKARIFLIIKGQSGYVANSLANDSTKQPSYDIVLRTAHEQLNS